MAQSGFTPIQLYSTSTASAVPINTNLAAGELALNTADEKLYFKNAAGTVKLLASNAASATTFSAGTTGLTPSSATAGAVTLAGTLAVANGGTGVTTSTGTGNTVLSTSPTLVTPALGTPTALVGTNITGTAAAFNLNGTVGATTPATGAFTDVNYTGTLTSGTGVVNLGSGQVYKDASGNVGIGTATPRAKLDISNLGSGLQTTGLHLGYSSADFYGYRVVNQNDPTFTAAGNFKIQRGTVSAFVDSLVIDNSGNVGIGTSSPAELLDVNSSVVIGLNTGERLSLGNQSLAFNRRVQTGAIYTSSAFAYQFQHTQGVTSSTDYLALQVYTPSGGSVSPEALVINASANVGIGTSSPASILHVASSAVSSDVISQNTNSGVSANNKFGFAIREASSEVLSLRYFRDGTGNSQLATAGPLLFATIGSERMRLDLSGNLMVGTTSNGGAKFSSVGNGGSLGASINPVSTTATALEIIVGANNTTQNAAYVYSTSIANFTFKVFSNGNVQNTNNSYGAISDVKLKENIVDVTPKLVKLNKVRVVNYNLIGQEQKQIGVIAQELEAVFPSLIDETPDRDIEGIDLGTTTKSVKYSVFVPMLIKAIQEQQVMIDTLKADVATLKGQA